MKKVFRSIEEFKRHYLPKSCEKERLEKMTVKEKAEYLAEKSLKKIRRKISRYTE